MQLHSMGCRAVTTGCTGTSSSSTSGHSPLLPQHGIDALGDGLQVGPCLCLVLLGHLLDALIAVNLNVAAICMGMPAFRGVVNGGIRQSHACAACLEQHPALVLRQPLSAKHFEALDG